MLRWLPVALALGVTWSAVRPGVWQTELRMADEGPLSLINVVALRLDPTQLDFTLQRVTRDGGMRSAWTIDSLPRNAVVALNAGQFTGGFPWGWLVLDGEETQPPGSGSLAMAFVVDSARTAALVTPQELDAIRGRARTAFQSYPALLVGDGAEPWELGAPGRGVDLDHRDARLALGILKDGSVVVALTRFNGLGGKAATLPWGPRVTEMSAFMRALGCQRAMLLDGGISSQLAVRNADGGVSRWANWRAVPLALVVTPHAVAAPAPLTVPSSSLLAGRTVLPVRRAPGSRAAGGWIAAINPPTSLGLRTVLPSPAVVRASQPVR